MAARQRQWTRAAVSWVPTGHSLSDARWPSRHRAMVWVIWLHLPALVVVGAASGETVWHVATELMLLAFGALFASSTVFSRPARTFVAVVTLVSCSAVLVHLTGGLTESHFHFFAVVAFITLYQEWVPFVVALAYVVVHHGVIGVLYPTSVYNHEAAWSRPVLWAFIHGGFVVLASLASLGAWRLAEVERESLGRVLDATGDGIYGVDAAGRITFVNRMLCELMATDRESLEGADHHEALGHLLTNGAAVEAAACPLCRAIQRGERQSLGEAGLQGSGDALPVEYVTRPMLTRSQAGGSVITVRDLRERRALEAERRLVEAERDQLASIVEAAPDLAIVGRFDGQLVWMNTAGRAMLRIEPSEDMGAYRFDDLFSPEELSRIQAEDMPAIARDGDWQGEWTLRTRDGDPVPVWVTQHVHHDAAGERAYVSGIMRDLRPQQAEERERREAARRLAAAEGVARLGSWEWDLVSDRVLWSPGMYRLHAMQPGDGEESYDAWLATVHPDDREFATEQTDRARSSGTGLDFSYRAVLADGRELVIHSRGEMIATADGSTSMLGTLLDITERHAAAEALRESEEQARSVIATAGDAYVQFGPDRLVTEWNDQAEEIFGWTSGEVFGRWLPSLVVAPRDRESFELRVGLGLDGEPTERERFEMTMLHRSGQEIPVEVTAWTLNRGNSPVFCCFVRDISERQAAERAKDEFVSVVGHELRTPLTSIHGALGLLRAGLLGDLNERGRRMVDIAAHNTDRLVRLINDILDIERLNSGRVSIHLESCDILALVERSVEAMRPMADTSGVRLEIAPQTARVWADPDRIEQTLTNLLSNAIKFSPAGTTVRLGARVDGYEVTVEVRDEGRGIPAEHLELIFDRFQQVDGSDAREKEGSGLGLAICRTIVEQHGGRIWAESGAGPGATVTFTLPAGPPVREPAIDAGPTVLICDDDAAVRDVVAALLGPHGYHTVGLPTGDRLVEAALEHRPAVILLDLHSPGMNGWEAAAALRDQVATRDIPVVVLSLHGEPDAASPSVSDRLDECIDAEALIAAVTRAIDSTSVGPTLLLVEDDQDLAYVLIEGFRHLGIGVHHASTARQALEMCAHLVPELLVLDLMLPDQDGYAVVAQLRRDVRLRGVPLAVYTASDLTEADRKRLRLGETKFFTKGRVTPDVFERHVVDLLHQLTRRAAETRV